MWLPSKLLCKKSSQIACLVCCFWGFPVVCIWMSLLIVGSLLSMIGLAGTSSRKMVRIFTQDCWVCQVRRTRQWLHHGTIHFLLHEITPSFASCITFTSRRESEHGCEIYCSFRADMVLTLVGQQPGLLRIEAFCWWCHSFVWPTSWGGSWWCHLCAAWQGRLSNADL